MKRNFQEITNVYHDNSSDDENPNFEETGFGEDDYPDFDMDEYIKMYEDAQNMPTQDETMVETVIDSIETKEPIIEEIHPFFRTTLTELDKSTLRRSPPSNEYFKEDIKFMVLKVEHDIGYRDTKKYGESKKAELILDIFGTTKEGYDVKCKVMGFEPYFYVEVNEKIYENGFTSFLNAFYDRIDDHNIKVIKDLEIVVAAEKLKKKSCFNHSDHEKFFFKIIVGAPQYIGRLKSILECGFDVIGFGKFQFLTYESNVAFHIRCMIDQKIKGSSWIELAKDTYHVVKYKESHCSIEVEIHKNHLIVHKSDKKWYEISPIRLLSYDIECLGKDGHFPSADLGDKIICISLVVKDTDKNEKISVILALEETNQTQGCTTYWFESEEDLLMAFKDMVVAINPDFLTGYNISGFDNAYIFKRAECLNLVDFCKLSKIKYKRCYLKESSSYSAQAGSKSSENALIYGRTNFDMHPIIIGTGFKFNDYTLNTVSREILKDQKNDLHYSHIPKLFLGAKEKKNGKVIEFKATPESRERITCYCEKDSVLPLNLISKIKSIETFVESSRVIGIQIDDLVSKGASLRSYAQFLSYAQEYGFLVPVNPCKKVPYQGATVIEPIVGYHTDPVSCGDFNSLYPSIMIYINGSTDTYIPPQNIYLYKKEEYSTFEVKIFDEEGNYIFSKQHSFMNKEIQEGIMPIIEKNLLGARAEVRKEIKTIEKQVSFLEIKKSILLELKTNAKEILYEKYNKISNENREKIKTANSDKTTQDSILDLIKKTIDTLEVLDKINEDDLKEDVSDRIQNEIKEFKSYLDILDKRQLALKISANSLYGWIAASTNSTACVPVSETITSVGRDLIMQSKEFVEKNFNIKNGYGYDSEVIYGVSFN